MDEPRKTAHRVTAATTDLLRWIARRLRALPVAYMLAWLGFWLRGDHDGELARGLRAWAQYLDPQPVHVDGVHVWALPGGGWQIRMDGLPLANISAGMITDTRAPMPQAPRKPRIRPWRGR
jgi:hypothetical protein